MALSLLGPASRLELGRRGEPDLAVKVSGRAVGVLGDDELDICDGLPAGLEVHRRVADGLGLNSGLAASAMALS